MQNTVELNKTSLHVVYKYIHVIGNALLKLFKITQEKHFIVFWEKLINGFDIIGNKYFDPEVV